ncbi:MAG: hypothetical protein ACRDGA_02025 [Bacteroidota bacterium]
MYSIKTIFALSVIVLLLRDTALAQENSASRSQNIDRQYSNGIVIKKDRLRFQAMQLVFTPETLTFVDERTGQPVVLPLADVEFVSAKTGTHALEGALIGGGLFLLAGLAAWAEVEADPTKELKENAGQTIALLTVAGAGAGLLIGMAFPKEETVFTKGKLVFLSVPPVGLRAAGGHSDIVLVSLKIPL